MKAIISEREENFDNFFRNKAGRAAAKERRQKNRDMRMRKREARTKGKELDADAKSLDNQAKNVQVGLTAKLADEATAPATTAQAGVVAGAQATGTAATDATGAPTSTGTPATGKPSKMLLIGSGIALLLIIAVVFFLVKK